MLTSLLASAWYPFELGKRLDQAIVQALGAGRPEFFEKLGEASAEKNLGAAGVHRGFLVPGDPQAFLAKTPLIYSYYYDQGRRDYEKTGEKEAVLTTHDAETFSTPDCLTVVGWYRRPSRCAGQGAPRRRGGVPGEGRVGVPLPPRAGRNGRSRGDRGPRSRMWPTARPRARGRRRPGSRRRASAAGPSASGRGPRPRGVTRGQAPGGWPGRRAAPPRPSGPPAPNRRRSRAASAPTAGRASSRARTGRPRRS